jgi:hypothetical protein
MLDELVWVVVELEVVDLLLLFVAQALELLVVVRNEFLDGRCIFASPQSPCPSGRPGRDGSVLGCILIDCQAYIHSSI